MKRIVSKIMLTLLLASMLTLAFNIQQVRSEPQTYATLQISPDTAMVIVSDTFTVDINIAGVVNLYSWQFKLYYKKILTCNSVAEGEFLKRKGNNTFWPGANINNNYNSTHGRIMASCSRTGAVPGETGNGVLAIITFTALSTGNTTLHLFETGLWDPPGVGANPISHTTIDGLVSAQLVRADFSVSSPDIVFSDSNPSEGQTVTISAIAHNIGEMNVENVTIQFFDATTLIGEQRISFISHHSQGTGSMDWTAEGEGFHLIKVVVDPANAIVETDEENNEATRSILVGEIPHFGRIVVNGSATPNGTLTGWPVTVQGYAEYDTTYGAGEPVAGAEVTMSIMGWQQETTRTIKDGTFNAEITAPYSPGNYSVIVTVTDFTFWESIEIGLNVSQEEGVDLTLSRHDISFSPPDPIENESVDITATIHNIGTDNATNVLVAFYDDGEPIGNRTIDLIPGGGNKDTTISWNAIPRGLHTVSVVIDPENTTGELNEDNNEASKDIYVYPPLPDLTPTSIGFSDTTPVVNQPITISANVRNIGGIEASNVLVSFYDDGEPIGNATIPWIPGKGGSRTASITHSFTLNGLHLICVRVDPYNDISESDDENNQNCLSIYVHLPSPDLTLSSSDITFSDSRPTVGDIIRIYATIHNIGEKDAYDVTVELLADSIRINYTTIPFIPAGGQETIDGSWNATPVGTRRIQVIVDGNNTIMESNENNNMATRYIYVYPEVAADLCIHSEDIAFSNINPDPGENVTIYATVHNIGEAEAHNVTVTFYVDYIQLGSPETIHSISVGRNETASTKWIASKIGSHVVKVITDTPIESDKNNNVATRAIIVGAPPKLEMNPTVVTCRKYCENFIVQINATDAVNVEDLEFEIHYNATLLDYVDVTWNAWGTGTIDSSTDGILIGYTSGTPINGNATLITIEFHAAYYHIWKDCLGWTNDLTGTIYFQWVTLSYPDAPDLRYEKDGLNEIIVDPIEVNYTFSPIQGDVNNNGTVNMLDISLVAWYYEQNYPAYDLNCDGIVDIFDLVIIAANLWFEHDC